MDYLLSNIGYSGINLSKKLYNFIAILNYYEISVNIAIKITANKYVYLQALVCRQGCFVLLIVSPKESS